MEDEARKRIETAMREFCWCSKLQDNAPVHVVSCLFPKIVAVATRLVEEAVAKYVTLDIYRVRDLDALRERAEALEKENAALRVELANR